MKLNLKAYIAEAIGTFALVFFACGVAFLTKANVFMTAFAFGLAIVVVSTVIGKISGCHINPAVSFACFMTKRMSLRDFVGYVIAQIIGGILGGIILFAVLKIGKDYGVGAFINTISNRAITNNLDAGPIFGSLILEVILTFVFVYVILHVTDDRNGFAKAAGVIIAATLVLVHLIGIQLTGTSVNPARSIGAAFAELFFGEDTDALKHVWIFIIAPMGGAALAAVVYNLVNKPKAVEEQPKEDAAEEKTAE